MYKGGNHIALTEQDKKLLEEYERITERNVISITIDEEKTSGSASNMNGNDQTTIHLRAAANYINNGGYDEALNVLNSMEDRDARWYYYSAQANAGKGNQATAMEHARRAVELAPDNMQYRMFYQRMNSGGEWYTGRQQTYQNPGSSMGGWCMRLILLNLACNCCLGGGGLCCPGGYYY